MYAYIIDNKVRELIPDVDKAFPDVSIEQRYPAEMLAKCVHIEDNTDVRQGMIYDEESGDFREPDSTIVYDNIDDAKAAKVDESKVKLAEWLNTHPILYTDEKYYSVTEEKQTLLNSNLASYERAEKLGMIYTLKWNAVGEKCVEWSYNNLTNLSLTIAAYVGERVSQQQVLETEIQACETLEELDKIVIHYV